MSVKEKVRRFCGGLSLSKKRLILCLAVLAAGAVYWLFVLLTGVGVPCLFQTVTGLACPGCGATHFFTEAFQLRFANAARENLALAVLLPVWAVSLALGALFRKDRSKRLLDSRFFVILAWASAAALLVFGVVRNLPGCESLLPSYMG